MSVTKLGVLAVVIKNCVVLYISDFAANATSLCAEANCSHLCLPTANPDQSKPQKVLCYCSDGFELDSDKKTCVDELIDSSTTEAEDRGSMTAIPNTKMTKIKSDLSTVQPTVEGNVRHFK